MRCNASFILLYICLRTDARLLLSAAYTLKMCIVLSSSLISMRVSVYVSLLHDSASGGARTALAPCLETWLAPWLAPCYGSRRPTLYLLAMIWPLLLVGSLQYGYPLNI